MLALTLAAIGSYAKMSLPQVSYIKCIDIWAIACLLFVAAALTECVIVDYLTNNWNGVPKKCGRNNSPSRQMGDINEEYPLRRNDKLQNSFDETILQQLVERIEAMNLDKNYSLPTKKSQLALRIKRLSRVFFPVFFLLFNILFWSVYTLPKKLL